MRIPFIFLFVASFMAISFVSEKPTEKTSVTIRITNIRSKSGSLRFGIYRSQNEFENEKPHQIKSVTKADMKNGVVEVEMPLEEGYNGLALLDDENNNTVMDYGILLPNEGFGFSNYVHSGLTRPKFDAFKFHVKSSAKTTVTVKVKYM